MSLRNPASVIILLLLVVVFNSSCGTLTNLSVVVQSMLTLLQLFPGLTRCRFRLNTAFIFKIYSSSRSFLALLHGLNNLLRRPHLPRVPFSNRTVKFQALDGHSGPPVRVLCLEHGTEGPFAQVV